MDNNVYKALKEWADLAYKNHSTTKDEWTDVPNVGKFKNLKFIPAESTQINEINITMQYDEWEESTTGKFIRELEELTKTNLGIDQYLVDDPTHHYYSEFPQLIIYPDGKENQVDSIIVDKGNDDKVWINGPGSTSYVCKADHDEVIHCLVSVIAKYRKESDKNYPPLPCEHLILGFVTAKKDLDEIGIKTGWDGFVTKYSPKENKFNVIFTTGKKVMFPMEEKEFLELFDYKKKKK